MTTAVLATRLIAGLGCLVDVARVIYDGVEAKQITDAEGIDIGAEIAEITFLCHGLSTPSQYQQCVDGPGLTSGQTQICWGIVYGSVFLITALESLNGWGPPDPGKDFTDGQKKIDHVNTILAGAGPQPDQWSDSGAATYDEANKTLAALVQRLATSSGCSPACWWSSVAPRG